MIKGKKIVIGITGSIAAYKIPLLVRMLVREGAEVQVIMTPVAVSFTTPLTLSTLSQRPVIIDPFKETTGEWNNHVELGRWADLMLFAPVSANTLGKMAGAIADNFLVTAYLSAKCPVFIAPAMDLDMYLHPATQKNISILQSYGNRIIEPQTGELASGLIGPGRMEEPEQILSIINDHFSNSGKIKKKILVTAGPTYEKIDPVRFIGNFSTGKMGFAIAEEAAKRGAEVVLITGPVSLETVHKGIRRYNVLSAGEMFEKCMEFSPWADIIIMSAAVADYKPANESGRKVKKGQSNLNVELAPNPDILLELGKRKPFGQLLAGFALETDNERENAVEKLKRKNLDLIVLNSLNDIGAGFGHPTNKVTVLNSEGVLHEGELKSKEDVAVDLIDILQNLTTIQS